MSTNTITTDERQAAQLVEWNATRVDYPRDSTIHRLFEEQAARTPDACALEFESASLTYAELNQRANQLAHHLRSCGIGPEVMVCVCLERSLEMVVTLLAILKAGGAYVPLDPGYPQARLTFMLADTKTPVVLTQKSLRERLPQVEASVICIEDALLSALRETTDNQSTKVDAEGLAYVMYTSGSTGQPKGVMVSHRAVVRLVKSANYIDIRPDDVFLQLAPISFDASTLELWAPLLNGARLAIMPPQSPSLEEIGSRIRKHHVTTMWLTAGLFNLMVEQRLADLAPLRQLLAGGEALSPPHVFKALRAHPGCRLINGYGPTENTTFTCCHTITVADQAGDSIPIGKPVSNTQVYLLDEDMNPVPVGVTGELYAGGDGVARGYWSRPELTAERFVRDPFSDEKGARLYKTGDLAFYRADGVIEFLGRRDNQVKIAGNRIELGEIEAALRAHPAVQSGVVIVREDVPGEKKLVAYLVPSNGALQSSSEMRSYLQERLPNFMVPAAFVPMVSLPLSPNGKVDRQLLPAPEAPSAGASILSAKSELESMIAEIWKKVLRLQQVGMDDNFFDAGGDSLQLIAVHAELSKLFSIEVTITDLFEYSTISTLAKHLEAGFKKKIEGSQERAERQRTAMARVPRTAAGLD